MSSKRQLRQETQKFLYDISFTAKKILCNVVDGSRINLKEKNASGIALKDLLE
jgi:hypothetical protein